MARNEYCFNCAWFLLKGDCPHYWEIAKALKNHQRDGWGDIVQRACPSWVGWGFDSGKDNNWRWEEFMKEK